jgi:restriction endonuclease Mrr
MMQERPSVAVEMVVFGIIKEDKLDLDAIYIQAKRWEGTVAVQ